MLENVPVARFPRDPARPQAGESRTDPQANPLRWTLRWFLPGNLFTFHYKQIFSLKLKISLEIRRRLWYYKQATEG